VSAGTAVLANIGSDEFNVKLYDSLSTGSHVLLSIKERGQVIILSAKLWRLNKNLENLMQQLQDIAEGKRTDGASAEPLTPERTDAAISGIEQLGRTLEYIYEQSRRRQLTNNSLVAGNLRRISKYAECLFDVADWLHVTIQPDEVSNIFQRSIAETERGEHFRYNSGQIKYWRSK